jgi:PleD family two-component response regulator
MVNLRSYFPILRRRDPERDLIVEKAVREAAARRRLAINDRETGLYAYWYLRQRFEEERKRSERYGHPLSVMLIEVRQDADLLARDSLADWLLRRTRSCDLAGHLGDGRYIVFMPETTAEAAALGTVRLSEQFGDTIAVGLSAFPADGSKLVELEMAAQGRLRRPEPAAFA